VIRGITASTVGLPLAVIESIGIMPVVSRQWHHGIVLPEFREMLIIL